MDRSNPNYDSLNELLGENLPEIADKLKTARKHIADAHNTMAKEETNSRLLGRLEILLLTLDDLILPT